MEFSKVLALRGPNIWAGFPVLEAWLDLCPPKGPRADELPDLYARLVNRLPALLDPYRGIGGLLARLQGAACPARVLGSVALELQSLAGARVSFGHTRQTSTPGVYQVVVAYEEEELGKACLESARQLCLAAIHDQAHDIAGEVERLRGLAERLRPDPATAALLAKARQAGIPACRLTPGRLLLLGQGARQRRFLNGQTDRTGAIAEAIAGDRNLTYSLLRAVGVPTPSPDGPGLPAGANWRLLVVRGRVAAASGPRGGGEEAVHPEIAARAAEAAGVVGLDVAEVGVVARSLTRPLEEQGGVVETVDAHADLGRFGPAGAGAVLEHLFPAGQTGRIPVVAVTGVNGKTTTTRLIARTLVRWGLCVGMTSTEGIYLFERGPDADPRAGRRIEAGDCSGPVSARTVLQHPRVEAAVLETARGGILRAGLGFDRCDVAVVTNIGAGDHLGLSDISTPGQLARVKRTVVEAVAPGGTAVLKADDPLVADMAAHCPGEVTYFGRNPEHPVLVKHLREGRRAVLVRQGWIVLAEGRRKVQLVPLEQVPLTGQGRIGFQVENALAAAAAAWSLDVPLGLIAATLRTFSANLDQTPARFNLLEVNGATAVFDYGHNADSLACLIEVLDQLPHARRSVVYSAAGDRRDGDMVRMGELLGDAFDRVILYEEEHCVRGRPPGAITALFRQGLAGRRRVREVEELRGAIHATETTLASARPGDLVLVQVDLVDETIELVRRLVASGAAREIDFSEARAMARTKPVPFADKPVLGKVARAIVTGEGAMELGEDALSADDGLAARRRG